LIIGAGIGGIAAAAHLARSGYEVTVLEKNSTPGGRCSQFMRDGHRFDVGPTLFLIPQVFEETYASLGERMEDHLDLRRIDPTYRFHFDDGSQLDLTADLTVMQSQLEAMELGSFGALLRYLVEGHQALSLSLEDLVGRNFYVPLEYFSLQNLQLLFKLKALARHYDNVGNYFEHPYLRAAFSFQNMYLGMSPFDAPATYSLLRYAEFVDGVWLPIGGLYCVTESLESIAQANGAQFLYGAPVKQIEVEGNRVTGVLMDDGSRRRADVIVANADLPYVYRHLLPDGAEADRLERKEYTCSCIMFYWGVDKVYPQLVTHNLFMAGDYRGSFDRIFNENGLPDEPNFYVHAPTRTDPSAAPPGQDTLTILVPAGRLSDAEGQDGESAQDRNALRSKARAAVLRRLAELGLTELEEHLKFEDSYTPRTWMSRYNLAKGAAFGSISHLVLQVGYLRPKNRHRRYRNLYFAGGSTHPGNGLPLVLRSARLTTERIVKELGAPRPQ
jgi:phytoene desaturase